MNALSRFAALVALLSGLLGACANHHTDVSTEARRQLEVRALVAPAVAYHSVATHTANPLDGIEFAVPTSEAEYDRLSAPQQVELSRRVAGFDCAASSHPSANMPVVACDSVQHPSTVMLLGPTLLTNSDVSQATARQDQATGSWEVALTLMPAGQTTWSTYSAAHHTLASNQVQVADCGAATVPCADFTAFTVDSVVISTPYTVSPIADRTTLISGSFTRKSATDLARALA